MYFDYPAFAKSGINYLKREENSDCRTVILVVRIKQSVEIADTQSVQ